MFYEFLNFIYFNFWAQIANVPLGNDYLHTFNEIFVFFDIFFFFFDKKLKTTHALILCYKQLTYAFSRYSFRFFLITVLLLFALLPDLRCALICLERTLFLVGCNDEFSVNEICCATITSA